jgi:hypothetical protein
MALNPYFTNGINTEQNLIEDLVIEQIKMFGKDVYYIPRTLVKEDKIFGEDVLSKFESAWPIEVYITDIDGFRGDGDMYSKFGIRITDEIEFVMSRKRFAEAVDGITGVGFQIENLMNYSGQSTVQENSVSVGLGNPSWGQAIQANPSNYEIIFNDGLTVTIASATGTESPGAEWTFTGTWPANATGAPLTIRSKNYVPEIIGANLIAEGRPNEGDLIYLPLSNDLFEIKFVEHEKPFYQLGKGYVWTLRCELFEYSQENLNTGIPEIDSIEINNAYQFALVLSAGGTGDFEVGEIITGEDSNTTAEVVSWDGETRKLVVMNPNGDFSLAGELIVGSQSESEWQISSFSSIDSKSTQYKTDLSQNKYFEDSADDILDFTEGNPFGEYGDMGDKF